MLTMLATDDPVRDLGVGEVKLADGYRAAPIRLYRNPRYVPEQRYAVQYGKQLDYRLSYREAAEKLGEAMMHSLVCEGKMDGDE